MPQPDIEVFLLEYGKLCRRFGMCLECVSGDTDFEHELDAVETKDVDSMLGLTMIHPELTAIPAPKEWHPTPRTERDDEDDRLFWEVCRRYRERHPFKMIELTPEQIETAQREGLFDVDFKVNAVWMDVFGKEIPE